MAIFVSMRDLKSILDLQMKRQAELQTQVKRLELKDVKTDAVFNGTKEKIKHDILLRPVTIHEPKIKGHRVTEKPLIGGPGQLYVITVQYPFEGSPELFTCMPNNYMYGGSNPMVYLPNGNVIEVDVEAVALNKEQALNKAQSLMDTTFSLITGNNEQAKEWSERMEPGIETMLEAKRKELIEFYS